MLARSPGELVLVYSATKPFPIVH